VRPRSLDEYLKKAHVPFTVFQHPEAFSAQRGAAGAHVPGRSWAKTVVCLADAEPILAVIPAHLMVDLELLRALANAATLTLAREPDLAELFPGCELGAISPLLSGWGLRVFVDQTLVGEPEMVFSAGTHTDAIRMHYGDFAELIRPVVGVIGGARNTPPAARARPTQSA
jgi:Ala-tRNA(Pro) deacylase